MNSNLYSSKVWQVPAACKFTSNHSLDQSSPGMSWISSDILLVITDVGLNGVDLITKQAVASVPATWKLKPNATAVVFVGNASNV